MSMLYTALRGWARLGLWIFTDRVTIERDPGADSSGPAILACNHPNSFLDAILMGVFHPRPLHFLARGDAFRKPWAARILRSIGAIPIHRLSEGREHLYLNDETFRECLTILRGGGTVLIFSEGLSQHGDGVRPLRKGTARLAWMAWHEEGLREVAVQPVRFRYQSFTSAPKRVAIRYAAPIGATDIPTTDSPSHFYLDFNQELQARLSTVPSGAALRNARQRVAWLWLLAPFAVVGVVSQGWYYLLVKRLAQRKTRGTVFYDSVLFGLLLLTYPLLVLLVAGAAAVLWKGTAGIAALLVLPFTAWALKSWVAKRREAGA